eukprot:CAMPEP_0198491126 /NCGR_PEP_ID=MMETSP1462-20131121/2579_1 /TAXON_ID=1333877 /ORGANISM="Brandtodinium nutriculum, Strain RCC3387" /LENGTH=163 /DNA_ID=CAMNT_0044219713 /DNA_START=53 /DNA_END=541 /DNA_ORIENTATION=-
MERTARPTCTVGFIAPLLHRAHRLSNASICSVLMVFNVFFAFLCHFRILSVFLITWYLPSLTSFSSFRRFFSARFLAFAFRTSLRASRSSAVFLFTSSKARFSLSRCSTLTLRVLFTRDDALRFIGFRASFHPFRNAWPLTIARQARRQAVGLRGAQSPGPMW